MWSVDDNASQASIGLLMDMGEDVKKVGKRRTSDQKEMENNFLKETSCLQPQSDKVTVVVSCLSVIV